MLRVQAGDYEPSSEEESLGLRTIIASGDKNIGTDDAADEEKQSDADIAEVVSQGKETESAPAETGAVATNDLAGDEERQSEVVEEEQYVADGIDEETAVSPDNG